MRLIPALAFAFVFGSAATLAQAPAPAAAPSPALKVADMAPDFSLQGSDGKTHRLSDYRGKQAVVIAWFPKAFTQGCTIECKSLAENGDKIKQYDVTYFMASVDNIEDNTKFAKATSVTLQGRGGQSTVVEKKEADFPMLADPTKETATKYGVLDAAGQYTKRVTFVIDDQGILRKIVDPVDVQKHGEDLAILLEELKSAK